MQCKAKAHSTGVRCRSNAIAGGTVCRVHGGSAPQVKRKAAERLKNLAHPAIDHLQKALKDKKNPALALSAARDILDRVPETSKHSKLAVGAEVQIDDPGREKMTDEEITLIIAAAKKVLESEETDE